MIRNYSQLFVIIKNQPNGGTMKYFYKPKKLLVILASLVVFVFVSCVDTSGPVIPSSINYSSEMKVVNLVNGSGNTTLKLNGQSLGSVNFGDEYPAGDFLTVPSGSKSLQATFSGGVTKTYKFAAPTEYKFRVFLIGNTTDTEAKVLTQRYIWQTKNSAEGSPLFPEGKGQLLVFNGSPDATIKSIIVGTDTVEFATPLATGSSTPYLSFNSGSYSVKVIYNNTLSVSFNQTLGSKNRYTLVLYDNAASLKSKVFTDD